MCPHPLPHNPSGDPEGGAPCGRGPFRAGEESCVGERVMKKLWPTRGPGGVVGHSRTTKIIKSCNYKTKQLHCTTTPNQTIPRVPGGVVAHKGPPCGREGA